MFCRQSLLSMSKALRNALLAGAAPLTGGAALNENEQSNLQEQESTSSDSLLSNTFFFDGKTGFDR